MRRVTREDAAVPEHYPAGGVVETPGRLARIRRPAGEKYSDDDFIMRERKGGPIKVWNETFRMFFLALRGSNDARRYLYPKWVKISEIRRKRERFWLSRKL